MSDFQEVKLQGVNLTKVKGKPLTAFYLGATTKEGQYGTETHHNFQKENGELITVYGFTGLNLKMERVEPGTLSKVTYEGTAKIKTKKFGMKDVHQVKVEIDPTKSIADRLDKIETASVEHNLEPVEAGEVDENDPW